MDTKQAETVDECFKAMHNCKHCGGRPRTHTAGHMLKPVHYWVCSVCGEHGKGSASYAGAYDQWQKYNANQRCNMKQYPSFGSSHIDQPNDCGEMIAREQEAMRIRILESAKFAEWLTERMENRVVHRQGPEYQTLTAAEIGVIGYYIGMCDKDGLYRYMKELIGPEVESIVRKLEE